MDGELLFLRRCEQAAVLCQSNDEVEVLDLAGILRQMLVDQHALLDTANQGRIKPLFEVAAPLRSKSAYPESQSFWVRIDGLDPVGRPDVSILNLNRKAFLKHPVINNQGKLTTIKDVITRAANELGGVHHDPKPNSGTAVVTVSGVDITLTHIKSIARIVLRAIQPIIDDVRRRRSLPLHDALVPSPGKLQSQRQR